jgi:DNA (cytosine-5)-methyltransferase 1
MDTQGFGLPQRRQRVYLVASIEGSPQDVLLSEDVATERPVTRIGQQAHGFYWTEGLLGLGWAPDAIPTLRNGSSVGIPSPPAVLMPDGRVVKPRIRAAERLQGFPCDWTLPAERVARPAARWTLVGNAVSTPIPEWIGRRLMNPGRYDPCRNAEFPAKGRAPNAAWSDGRTRYGCDIGTDPLGLEAPDLAQFLGDDVELLSVRATAGFLERTARSKLKFHAGFLEAVRLHLEKMRIEQATKMEDGAPSAQKVLDAPLNTQRLSNPSMQQAKTPHTDQR